MRLTTFGAALNSSTVFRVLRNRFRFPGLGMASSVAHDIKGRVLYGPGCSIGQNSILIVPPLATLRMGDGVYVGRNVELGPGGTVDIGDWTSLQDRTLLVGEVFVGRYCIFSLNVLITSGRHYYELKPNRLIRDQDVYALADPAHSEKHHRPVYIEDDCWLGVNCVILPGVTVGKGCVVGANSVVTEDLPPYVVAAGAPARILKRRMEFAPPRRIDMDMESDLPYFYSGIGVSRDEQERARSLQGLFCDQRFSLALDSRGAKNICVVTRSLNGSSSISYLGESRDLGPEYRVVQFKISENTPSRFHFQVQGAPRRWPICIQKAWVE